MWRLAPVGFAVLLALPGCLDLFDDAGAASEASALELLPFAEARARAWNASAVLFLVTGVETANETEFHDGAAYRQPGDSAIGDGRAVWWQYRFLRVAPGATPGSQAAQSAYLDVYVVAGNRSIETKEREMGEGPGPVAPLSRAFDSVHIAELAQTNASFSEAAPPAATATYVWSLGQGGGPGGVWGLVATRADGTGVAMHVNATSGQIIGVENATPEP